MAVGGTLTGDCFNILNSCCSVVVLCVNDYNNYMIAVCHGLLCIDIVYIYIYM